MQLIDGHEPLEAQLKELDACVMLEAADLRLIGGPEATNELLLLDLAPHRPR